MTMAKARYKTDVHNLMSSLITVTLARELGELPSLFVVLLLTHGYLAENVTRKGERRHDVTAISAAPLCQFRQLGRWLRYPKKNFTPEHVLKCLWCQKHQAIVMQKRAEVLHLTRPPSSSPRGPPAAERKWPGAALHTHERAPVVGSRLQRAEVAHGSFQSLRNAL